MSRYKSKYETKYERSGANRYRDEGQQLNWGKIIFVLLFIAAVIFLIYAIKNNKQDPQDKTPTQVTQSSNYYLAFNNDKWGVIDNNGKEIIPAEYSEMISIPDSTKDVFICFEEVDYTNNTFKTKVLNKSKEQILTTYEKLEPISYINSENKTLTIKDKLVFTKEGKLGITDLEGNVVLEANFDEIKTDGKAIIGKIASEGEKYFTFFGKEITLEDAKNEQEVGISTEYPSSITGYTLKEIGELKYYTK